MNIQKTTLIFFSLLIFIACSSNEEYLQQARSEMQAKNWNKAIETLNVVVTNDANNFEAFNMRGVAYQEKGQYKNALLDFDRAIELNPKFYKAYYNRALTNTLTKNLETAKEDYDKAIELEPQNAELYLNRGFLMAELELFKFAFQDFDKTIQLDSTNHLAFYNRGYLKFQLGDPQSAIPDLEKTLQLEPSFIKGLHTLGMAWLALEENEKACLLLKQAESKGYSDSKAAVKQYCN